MEWWETFGFPTRISDFPIFVNGKYPRSPVCDLLAVIGSNNGYCCENSGILIDACVTDGNKIVKKQYAFVAAAYLQSSRQSFFSCNHSKNAITAGNHH